MMGKLKKVGGRWRHDGKSIDEEMPDHFQFLRAAINVVWVYNSALSPVVVDHSTFTTLMREARARLDQLEETFDKLKDTVRHIEMTKTRKPKKAA